MLKEFLGIGGYTREAEGFLSWQHLTFVSSLVICMAVLAVIFSRRNQGRGERECNRVLIAAALVMDGVELIKILLNCWLTGNWMAWLNDLPLFMCSIQFITLPLAAFSHGRIREAALDCVCIFGLLGALMGTYCAGNNYACYPVISIDNMVSGITHSTAGFASLYIMLMGLAPMKKQNMFITCGIIIAFSVIAYIVNIPLGTNYMFLMRGDGTPYDILYQLVSGNKVLYPLGVLALFMLYITGFYATYSLVRRKRHQVAGISA